MGTYMGNVGHLMQHWTLCEILRVARESQVAGLTYIDAHAMAPWATDGPRRPDDQFRNIRGLVRAGLHDPESEYERAWHNLLQRGLSQQRGIRATSLERPRPLLDATV